MFGKKVKRKVGLLVAAKDYGLVAMSVVLTDN